MTQSHEWVIRLHHHHHQSLNREGRWGTTDDFATSFLHFSLFSTALWDLPNSRPVHSLMLSSNLFLHWPTSEASGAIIYCRHNATGKRLADCLIFNIISGRNESQQVASKSLTNCAWHVLRYSWGGVRNMKLNKSNRQKVERQHSCP